MKKIIILKSLLKITLGLAAFVLIAIFSQIPGKAFAATNQITGHVYNETSIDNPTKTPLGANIPVAYSINGALDVSGHNPSVLTDANGYFSIGGLSLASGTIIILYLDTDGGRVSNIVLKSSGADIDNVEMYQNGLGIRSDTGSITCKDIIVTDGLVSAGETDVKIIKARVAPFNNSGDFPLAFDISYTLIINSGTTLFAANEVYTADPTKHTSGSVNCGSLINYGVMDFSKQDESVMLIVFGDYINYGKIYHHPTAAYTGRVLIRSLTIAGDQLVTKPNRVLYTGGTADGNDFNDLQIQGRDPSNPVGTTIKLIGSNGISIHRDLFVVGDNILLDLNGNNLAIGANLKIWGDSISDYSDRVGLKLKGTENMSFTTLYKNTGVFEYYGTNSSSQDITIKNFGNDKSYAFLKINSLNQNQNYIIDDADMMVNHTLNIASGNLHYRGSANPNTYCAQGSKNVYVGYKFTIGANGHFDNNDGTVCMGVAYDVAALATWGDIVMEDYGAVHSNFGNIIQQGKKQVVYNWPPDNQLSSTPIMKIFGDLYAKTYYIDAANWIDMNRNNGSDEGRLILTGCGQPLQAYNNTDSSKAFRNAGFWRPQPNNRMAIEYRGDGTCPVEILSSSNYQFYDTASSQVSSRLVYDRLTSNGVVNTTGDFTTYGTFEVTGGTFDSGSANIWLDHQGDGNTAGGSQPQRELPFIIKNNNQDLFRPNLSTVHYVLGNGGAGLTGFETYFTPAHYYNLVIQPRNGHYVLSGGLYSIENSFLSGSYNIDNDLTITDEHYQTGTSAPKAMISKANAANTVFNIGGSFSLLKNRASNEPCYGASPTYCYLPTRFIAPSDASSGKINVAKNWYNDADFQHNSGTVEFISTQTSELKGTTTFNNFTVNNTAAGKTLIFALEGSGNQIVNGSFTIQGLQNNCVQLKSSDLASANFGLVTNNGTADFDYTSISKMKNADSAQKITANTSHDGKYEGYDNASNGKIEILGDNAGATCPCTGVVNPIINQAGKLNVKVLWQDYGKNYSVELPSFLKDLAP